MGFVKLRSTVEAHGPRWTAVVAALFAVRALVVGALEWMRTESVAAVMVIVFGAVVLLLSHGVVRGSRASALAVLAIFVGDRVLSFQDNGPAAVLNPWAILVAVMLCVGLHGLFTRPVRTSDRLPLRSGLIR